MRVVTDVGLDEHEVRKQIGRDIRLQRGQREDSARTPFRIQPDRIKVDKGIVFLSVQVCASEKTRFRHILLIGLPGTTTCLDQVRQAGCINKAIVTVAVDSKSVAADKGYVVWQAGMTDCVILRQQSILSGKPVICRHLWIADH